MLQSDIDEIRACVLENKDKRKFHYFKDRYAFMLLAFLAPHRVPIRVLKRSPFAAILRKPCVQNVLAQFGDGVLHPEAFDGLWARRHQTYWLSLGQWGSSTGWYGADQTSRPGLNLVLHLNFTNEHDAHYRRLDRSLKALPFKWSSHPSDEKGRLTLAWARIDIDLERGEALIEEIQSDWVREANEMLDNHRVMNDADIKDDLACWFENDNVSVARFRWYIDQVLRPHVRLWSEATLAAAIWLLRREIGVRRIYCHTPDSGRVMKGFQQGDRTPPRSLYTDLPRRFSFMRTSEPPTFLRMTQHPEVQRLLREHDLAWNLLWL